MRHVDFAFAKSLQQVVGRKVHQLHFVGRFEDRIGNGLGNPDAGNLRNDVLQTLQMLHVQSRIDADAGFQEPHHVLPALGVRHARGVGMRKLVDQDQLRASVQRGVDIEFDELGSAVRHFLAGQHVEPQHERLGLGARLRFNVADHDIEALLGLFAAGFQHRVGFADPRRRTEKDFEFAASLPGLFGLHAKQQGVGIGSVIVHAKITRKNALGSETAIFRQCPRCCSARFNFTTWTRGSPSSPRVRCSVWSTTICRTVFASIPRALATRDT